MSSGCTAGRSPNPGRGDRARRRFGRHVSKPPGQTWTFFEIDPAVERIARNRSTSSYLADCGDACRVVIGDARQSLAADASSNTASSCSTRSALTRSRFTC